MQVGGPQHESIMSPNDPLLLPPNNRRVGNLNQQQNQQPQLGRDEITEGSASAPKAQLFLPLRKNLPRLKIVRWPLLSSGGGATCAGNKHIANEINNSISSRSSRGASEHGGEQPGRGPST